MNNIYYIYFIVLSFLLSLILIIMIVPKKYIIYNPIKNDYISNNLGVKQIIKFSKDSQTKPEKIWNFDLYTYRAFFKSEKLLKNNNINSSTFKQQIFISNIPDNLNTQTIYIDYYAGIANNKTYFYHESIQMNYNSQKNMYITNEITTDLNLIKGPEYFIVRYSINLPYVYPLINFDANITLLINNT
jgi:hypothetical protein